MKLIDSTIIIAAANENDQWHAGGKIIMDDLWNGNHGKVLMTDYVLSETITETGARLGGKTARKVYLALTNTSFIEIVYVTQPLLERTMFTHLKYDGKLSLADAVSVQLMIERQIKEILSFDSDFDRVDGIKRIK